MSSYALYPSLMDAYVWMTEADREGERLLRQQEFLDKINRVHQAPSEAASRGTALNNIVDAITCGDLIGRNVQLLVIGGEECYRTVTDGREWHFNAEMTLELADYVRGAVCQPYVEAYIETDYGDVRLYGYADYINGNQIVDLKTTSAYNVGKYLNHWQHIVYTYCAVQSGMVDEVDMFTYLVAQLGSKEPYVGNIYRETYNLTQRECYDRLRTFLNHEILPWINANQRFIYDMKIFNWL